MPTHLKNIAIVGGTGNIGGAALSALLDTKRFNITAITRADSTSTFPSGVAVKKGDYDDRAFLESALKGQDAFVITLGVRSAPDTQTKLIEAAAAAGVPWILPNEYGSDNEHPVMGTGPGFVVAKKLEALQKVRDSESSYIAYITGCWYDFSLIVGAWGIDVKARTAEIYGDGRTKASTTTLATAGLGIARLLSLPISTTDGSPSLSDYKNKSIFVESFLVSQREMLESVQKATGTTDKDWKIEVKDVDEVIKQGHEMLSKGDHMGLRNVIYGLQFKPDSGSNLHQKISNGVLGLKGDDLDEVTKVAVKEVEAGKKFY